MNDLLRWSHAHNCYDPFRLAKQLMVDIVYIPVAPNLPLGVANLKLRTIFLLKSLKNHPARYLICAHELCHIICHSPVKNYVMALSNYTADLELEANQTAIYLLIRLSYQRDSRLFDYFEVTYPVKELMVKYHLPENLRGIVEKEIARLWWLEYDIY